MQTYRVFYMLYGRNRSVPDSSPVERTVEELLFDVLPDMDSDGDFLGLIDSNGSTLQTAYSQRDDLFWVEIPRPKRGGSFGCWATYEELIELISSASGELVPERFPHFAFYAWSSRPPAPN